MNHKLNFSFYFSLLQSSFLILILASSCSMQEGRLSRSVRLISGDVNGVVIDRNGKKLVLYGNPGDEDLKADVLLLTHCRRDLLWAAKAITESDAISCVPAGEIEYFTNPDSFWNSYTLLRYHDYAQQTTKYPVNSLKVENMLQGGDVFKWQDLEFEVVNTPGYTRGAISYICTIDGEKIAFTGDLIYGDGQLFDLYSLQDKIPDLKIRGYHGYASRMADLIYSLQLIKILDPDIIVPSRGPVIGNPEIAIDKLIRRLQDLYSNYLSISAFHWYTGTEKQESLAQRVQLDVSAIDWMSQAENKDNDLPWLKHVNNSVLIKSENGSAFIIDCGMKNTYQKLLENKGDYYHKTIEGIIVTHYHDDHVDFIPELIDRYNCPVYITGELEDILTKPEAHRLPCLTTRPLTNISVVREGYKMQWNEFTFTFYNFPGQTIYHGAILVENKNDKVFFIGDSFSPSGLDDYCLQNRNLIQEGKGFYYCIDKLRKMPSDIWLVNQHIHKLFRFSPGQLDFMEQKLRERETILAELSPWDDINYFIDEHWARIYPYEMGLITGQGIECNIVVTNHQNKDCTYRITPGSHSNGLSFSPAYQEITLAANEEGKVTFTLSASQKAETGLHIVTANISFNDKNLHEWCDGMVQVRGL